MKYLQSFSLFESRTSGALTAEQEAFLDQHTRGTWSVNSSTGLVDVWGLFDCSKRRLNSLYGIQFGTVTGNFYCDHNQLTSLEGAPRTVEGYFNCSHNQLTSLEGAPQTVGGIFYCDDLYLEPGKWNLEGWLQVLRTGSPEAQKLILTIIGADYWNSEISNNPIGTLLRLAAVWDRLPENVKGKIRIPSNLQDNFDNFLDLERAGIF